MRIASIRSMDISNGEGIGVCEFTTGCSLHCENCFNSELWDFNAGELYTQEHEDKIIKLLEPEYIKRLSLLGGEPLLERNYEPLSRLIQRVRSTYGDRIKIWCYTGMLYDKAVELFPNIVKTLTC